MKYNIAEVASLQLDYMGFIFYEKSPRDFEGIIPELPKGIKKVGVFVDEDESFIKRRIEEHDLDCIQLHGYESPEFCRKLKNNCHPERSEESNNEMLKQGQHDIEIIKVFSIQDTFDFSVLKDYEAVCDYYLFDTKGKLPGGNGYSFNWSVLEDYNSTKPFFLSGGIGLENTDNIMSFLRRQESKYCCAIDVNSKFEIEPGLKNIKDLERFKNELSR